MFPREGISTAAEGKGHWFISAEGVALGRAMLRGANPTPEPLSCPSASPVPSAGLGAGPWILASTLHSPFVPSHPQCWGVLGFEDTAVVTPPSPGSLTHSGGAESTLFSAARALLGGLCDLQTPRVTCH